MLHQQMWLVVPMLAVSWSCGGATGSPDAGPTDAADAYTLPDLGCGPKLKAVGPACVPILDTCEGPGQIPVPGGGCKRVGVETCDGGLRGPPDWTCKRIGAERCDGGLRGPPDWTCKPVGPPTTCLAGWARTKDGWCEPVLPPTKCADGAMARLGASACKPVGTCGGEKWGQPPIAAGTLFVDGAFKGPTQDGSQQKPFASIGAALKAAAPQATIAVAAGTYEEALELKQPVTIRGRCPKLVLLRGPETAAVTVRSRQVKLSGLTVTGDAVGVLVTPKGEATLEQVVVAGCGGSGLLAEAGSTVTVRDSLFADNTDAAIFFIGAAGALKRVEVRDTRPLPASKMHGDGIVAIEGGLPAALTLEDSVVSASRAAGVFLRGGKATLRRVVVRDTKSELASAKGGYGVAAAADEKLPTTLTLSDAVVSGNRSLGVAAQGATAIVERTVVRDTLPQSADDVGGNGVYCINFKSSICRLSLRDSVLLRNRQYGLAAFGSKVTVTRSAVLETREQLADERYGAGIAGVANDGPASLDLSDVVVANNRFAGIFVYGGDLTLKRSVVEKTAPDKGAGKMGNGIYIGPYKSAAATLQLSDSRLSSNHYVGLSIIGTTAKVQRTVVEQTREWSSAAQADDLGGWGLRAGAASTLAAEDLLVQGNQGIGVVNFGSKVELKRAVIADTVPYSQHSASGYALYATYDRTDQALEHPPSVLLRDALVLRNKQLGIALYGGSGTIERTVVSSTGPGQGGGTGVQQSYYRDANDMLPQQPTPKLHMTDSLVVANHFIGVGVFGTEATLERVAIRDTKRAYPHGSKAFEPIGYGINIATSYEPKGKQVFYSKVTMRDCRLARNHSTTVQTFAAKISIERCAILDTRAGSKGMANAVQLINTDGRPGDLLLRDSEISGAVSAAMAVAASDARVVRSRIGGAAGTAKGEYGVGIKIDRGELRNKTVGGKEVSSWVASAHAGRLEVDRSVIETNVMAGVVFEGSGGSLHRSVVRRGGLSVVLNGGANPVIGADNVIEGNKEDRITVGVDVEVPTIGVPPSPL